MSLPLGFGWSGRSAASALRSWSAWHDNLAVFVTPEAKALGWGDKTIVKVSVVGGKIVIEKGMEL